MLEFPTNETDLLSLFKDYICENQLMLSQYSFMANEKHKNFKELQKLLETNKLKKNITETSDLQESLNKSFLELEDYLKQAFFNAFNSSYKCSKLFFSGRSKYDFRLCIKVFLDGKIGTLFRLPNHSYEKEDSFDFNKNTAFKHIDQGIGDYYLCNNIPEKAGMSEYENTRLSQEKVIAYNNSLKKNPFPVNFDGYDEKWAECWEPVRVLDQKDGVSPALPENCYKSTLVIPMSLITEKLEKQFEEHFELSRNKRRTIFGFLCFDHCNVDFFRKDSDSLFGYILADMLSLYLILQLTYTRYSSTYRQAAN